MPRTFVAIEMPRTCVMCHQIARSQTQELQRLRPCLQIGRRKATSRWVSVDVALSSVVDRETARGNIPENDPELRLLSRFSDSQGLPIAAAAISIAQM
jgi:hypothetical protein